MHYGAQQASMEQPLMPPPLMEPLHQEAAGPMTEGEIIDTRFGQVQVSFEHALTFDKGLLGIANSRQFMLTDLPSEKLRQFKLLQSLEERKLSFIALPLDLDNPIIERADLEKASEDIGVPLADLAALLIVSVHRSPTDVKLSVNARAPLLMDANRRAGIQYVFQHSRYQVQQLLSM